MLKEINIQDIPNIIFGNNRLDSDNCLPSVSNSKTSSGIFLDFITDSPTLKIQFTLDYKHVHKLESPILSNGFSYLVNNEINTVVKQSNCYSWRGGENEISIIERKEPSPLHYFFFFPSFNLINNFKIMVDEGFELYSQRTHSNPIILIGNSIVSGKGCCYPNSMVIYELAQNTSQNIVGLDTDSHTIEWIADTVRSLNPCVVIVDLTTMLMRCNKQMSKQLIQTLSKQYRLIVISSKRIGPFKFFNNNIKYIRYPNIHDDQSYICNDILNDHGHYLISQLLLRELKPIMCYNDYHYYDIFELKNCIHGAPNVEHNTLKKILDIAPILRENNETNSRFYECNDQTSGIRLRFRTKSKRIKMKFELVRKVAYQRVMVSSSSGFDIYYNNNKRYRHLTVISPNEQILSHEEIIELPKNDFIEIYFPSYNSIRNMSIGVQEGSIIEPVPYEHEKSLIFYGNSCTQGGGSSRSGLIYPNIVSRKLSIDIFNYAFNACCRGEQCIAEELSSKDAAAFIIDYQYNSTITELKMRYEPFYRTIRSRNPKIPIILMDTLKETPLKEHIKQVYENNRSVDDNLYYIELSKLFANYDIGIISVDGIHVSDIGTEMIADSIIDIIKPHLT